MDSWNEERNRGERIYISYDSTNKNCEAGNISMVEFGAVKTDTGLPIFNYAIGYDLNNHEPLMYEKYPTSINDVSQLQFMVEKVKGYGYWNIGFVLDRGYFSKENLRYMDSNGFGFIIMVKGCKEFINLQVICDELDLCGYFAVITFEKMNAKEAISLYKNRDSSEKVFRADKSYLGNHCLCVASEEAAANKNFIGFIALIIRCRLYTALKVKEKELVKKA